MADRKTEAAASTGKGVKILLALSLGVNMLVVGAVGGMIFAHRGDSGMRPNLRDMSYGPYTRALSREDRKAIGVALRRETGSFQQNMPKTREMYRALLAVLKADVYDRDAVHKLVKDQQAIGLNRQQVGQRLLLDRLDGMTPKERRGFANRLERALLRGVWGERDNSGG